jgi:hypothetical protein
VSHKNFKDLLKFSGRVLKSLKFSIKCPYLGVNPYYFQADENLETLFDICSSYKFSTMQP